MTAATPPPPLAYQIAQLDGALTRHGSQVRMAELAGHDDTVAHHRQRLNALLEERLALAEPDYTNPALEDRA